MMALAATLAVGFWLAAPAPATATPKGQTPPAEQPMQVYLVRSAEPGCEPRCLEWIAAQGKIEEGTVARFKKVLRQLGDRKLPLLIDSSGGRVSEAFEIGRLIRARGLDVAVSGTDIVPCPVSDPSCRGAEAQKVRLGVPQADLSKCASACAFVLAAGARRLVGASAFVGLHRIRTFRVLLTYRGAAASARGLSDGWVTEKVIEIRTPQRTYDQIRRYFTEMGIDEGVMPLILSTPADRLHWLSRGELRSTRLATHWIGGMDLLAEEGGPPALDSPPATAANAGSDTGTETAAPPAEVDRDNVSGPATPISGMPDALP